jgi:hypothetical protein
MKTTNVLRCFLALLFLLITCTARAATVSWTGAGGDNLWQNPTNWNGGAVPTFGDDVIVNVPGSPVITIDATGVNVRSIQCAESLRLENANLSLSDGLSTFAGPLHLAAGWISINGASTVVNASGPTTWLGTSFYAYDGASFWLTNLTTLVMTNTFTSLQAAGADAAIHLSNLTNVVASESGHSLAIHASGGGLADLKRVVDLRGYFSAYSTSAGSVVDLSSLATAGSTSGNVYFTADGGAILVPKVAGLFNATIAVNGDGRIDMPLLTDAEGSSFSANGGAKLWLTNLTTLIVSNYSMGFSASGVGSEIHISNVTNLIGEFIYGNANLTVTADQGGLVNLGGLRHVSGAMRVTSRNAGSGVNLSGLSGTITGPERGWHNFIAEEGDILMPLVTGLKRATVAVYGDGQVGFGSLSTADGSSFFAYAGAKLWLTNLTELVVEYYGTTLSASGADSLIDVSSVTNVVNSQGYGLSINTYEGGKVDLHRLDKPGGSFTVTSQSPGSVVDLSGFSGTLGAPASLYVAYGGVIFMPQVTAFYGVTVSVTGDGEVVTGPLTRIEGSAFYAYDGAKIWLTNLTTLTLTDSGLTLNARGADAAIYLSNVTNVVAGPYVTIGIHVSDGGLVDLQALRSPGCVLNVYVQSAGSIVDLSSFTGTFTGQPNSYHSISVYGGSVLMPGVNALERVNAYLSGEGSMVTAQLHSLVNSTLSVDNATNDFSQLTNLVDSSVYASTGAKLWLTNVTTLYITNGSVSLQASGADAALYLPNVTNAVYGDTAYSLFVGANGGGEVDLRRLPNPVGRFYVNSSSSGSVVNLSAFKGTLSGTQLLVPLSINASYDGAILMPDVTALERVELSIVGEVQLPLANWGAITSSRVFVQSGTNDFGGLTNVLGTSFSAYNGGKLWLTNLTTLFVTNGTVYLQAWYEESGIYLPNVTNIVIDPSSAFYIYSFYGGDIDLHAVGGISGGAFSVTSRGLGSVTDLSGLTALTPSLGGSSLYTDQGGVILLNDTAVLISNVALNFEASPNSIIPDFVNPGTDMVLYAHAWDAYLIEARDTRVPNSPWNLYLRVPMTNVIQTVAARPPADLAFRVTPLLADPPALRIDRLADQQTQVTLFGLPGQTYRIESKSALGTAEAWQNDPAVTLTNAFRIFPEAASAEPSRYYRARKL